MYKTNICEKHTDKFMPQQLRYGILGVKIMYYKIIETGLKLIPKYFVIDGLTVTGGFSEEFANEHGYYAVDWTQPPTEEGYVPVYTLVGNRIKMEWIAE